MQLGDEIRGMWKMMRGNSNTLTIHVAQLLMLLPIFVELDFGPFAHTLHPITCLPCYNIIFTILFFSN